MITVGAVGGDACAAMYALRTAWWCSRPGGSFAIVGGGVTTMAHGPAYDWEIHQYPLE